MKLLWKSSLSAVLLLMAMTSFAEDAPVVDASTSYQDKVSVVSTSDQPVDPAESAQDASGNMAEPTDNTSNPSITTSSSNNADAAKLPLPVNLAAMPTPLRVRRLEQQVNNIANMNFPQQVAELQQQVAQLRGQLEVQQHDLQSINKQLQMFYKDLDNRIGQLSHLNAGGGRHAADINSARVSNDILKAPTNLQLQEANAYQLAFNQLTSHQFDKAQRGFLAYLTQYSKGKYVADASYWLGEIYLTKKDYKNANDQFQAVISKYPNSAKVSDAKLKVAIIHASTGKIDQARIELNSIKTMHPNSTAAQLANIRLQQINQSSNLASH